MAGKVVELRSELWACGSVCHHLMFLIFLIVFPILVPDFELKVRLLVSPVGTELFRFQFLYLPELQFEVLICSQFIQTVAVRSSNC